MIDPARLALRAYGRREGQEAVKFLEGVQPAGEAQAVFWEEVRDLALRHAPFPQVSYRDAPMSDTDATHFECMVRMPFGVHEGRLIGDVPLRYLDWLVGQRENDIVAQARAYLLRPAVKERLRKELEDDDDQTR